MEPVGGFMKIAKTEGKSWTVRLQGHLLWRKRNPQSLALDLEGEISFSRQPAHRHEKYSFFEGKVLLYLLDCGPAI